MRYDVPLEKRQKVFAEMKTLHDAGTSYAEIGRRYGVTRERARQWIARGQPTHRSAAERSVEAALVKLKARRAKWVINALRAGNAAEKIAKIDAEIARLE